MLDRRLLVVTGKGGVGRSALSTALGIRAARTGRRVLLIGMTDSLGLAAHVNVGDLGYKPVEVRPGLSAMAINPPSALDDYLRTELHMPRLGPMTGAFRVLADTVPGIRDIIVVGKVIHESRRADWDLVIADGPPIGQVVSYLRAPSVIRGLVPAGRVRRQAGRLEAALADPGHTALILVTTPEELPVTETLAALADLEREPSAAIGALVVNRMLPDPPARYSAVAGPAGDAAALHAGLAASQRAWVDRLPEAIRLPYLFGLLTPPEAAARLADLWASGAA